MNIFSELRTTIIETLDAMVVTATRRPAPLAETLAPVIVIDEAEIRHVRLPMPSASSGSALRRWSPPWPSWVNCE